MADRLNGTIKAAYVSTTYEPARVCFNVELEDGRNVVCRHKLDSDHAAANVAGFKSLDLEFPAGLRQIADTVGKSVPIRTSDYQGKTYFFLATFGSAKPASTDEVDALVKALSVTVGADRSGEASGDDPDIPF